MSVRPIDIQQIVMQVENVQKVQQAQHNSPQQQQAHTYLKHVEQEEIKRKQAPPPPRAEDLKIREEGKHTRQKRYIPQKNKKSVFAQISEDTPHKVDIQI